MLIGLCGYAQTGKNTAAKGLQNFEQYSLAKAIKDEVNLMLRALGINVDVHGEDDKKAWRDTLVHWGRVRRVQNASYWLDKLGKQLDACGTSTNKVVTDVRRLDEVHWILNRGGYIIRLHRPGFKPINETEYMSFNLIDSWMCNNVAMWDKLIFRLNNDSTINNLHRQVQLIADNVAR